MADATQATASTSPLTGRRDAAATDMHRGAEQSVDLLE